MAYLIMLKEKDYFSAIGLNLFFMARQQTQVMEIPPPAVWEYMASKRSDLNRKNFSYPIFKSKYL